MVAKDPEADRSRGALKLTAEVHVKGCRLPSGESLSARVSGIYVDNPRSIREIYQARKPVFSTVCGGKIKNFP